MVTEGVHNACRSVIQGDHYKYDLDGLHPLGLIPGRILHKRAENFTTRLKGRQIIATVLLI